MEDDWYGDQYKNLKPLSILGFIATLYTNTEIFEFAYRLGEKGVLGEEINVSIELYRNKDRSLFSMDWRGFLSEGYRSTLDIIPYQKIYNVQELHGTSRQLSLYYTIWPFQRFQWMDPSKHMLQEAQKKFLERRL